MSHAELTAHQLYETMHLGSISDEVKRHLIILMLSSPKKECEAEDVHIHIPMSYDEAMMMGAVDIKTAREELHSYIDELTEEFDLK